MVLRSGEEEETNLMTKEAIGGCSLVKLETSGYNFTLNCLFLSTVRNLHRKRKNVIFFLI
jgi:hypothetical protein